MQKDTDLVLDIPSNFREEDEIEVLEESEDIAKLRTILDKGEVVLRLILCIHEGTEAVLVATNKRVVFCNKKFINSTVIIMSYSSIASVLFQKEGVFMRITLASVDQSLMIAGVDRMHGNRFVRFLGDKIGKYYKPLEKNLKVYEYKNEGIVLD